MQDERESVGGTPGRKRDLVWEALVRETAANPASERGRLNAALKAIRQAAFSEGLVDDEAIAHEVALRAQAYRDSPQFGHCVLSPNALATNWFRVMVRPNMVEPSRQQSAIQQARLAGA